MQVEQAAGSRFWKRLEAPRQRLRLLGIRSPARLRLIFFSLVLLLSPLGRRLIAILSTHCLGLSNTFTGGGRLLPSMSEDMVFAIRKKTCSRQNLTSERNNRPGAALRL